ncbi:HPr family phosphocarrier protein [Caenibacillus caldisaponilyticus]|uniref:HPr family phosphocarrier protein n=1 Tax=Caenibacillus caldisaponilyticus TaxID=1674942 RepID=UPI0011774FA5|nr:HPr family phosphocarrier protein [Caenibacillus caldisaponilyticus]
MIKKTVEVKIENGLHARPAGELVKRLKDFKSDVYFLNGQNKVNLKSILQIMATSVRENDVIEIIAEGADESEALACVENFLQKRI